jgi:hypothetical protein
MHDVAMRWRLQALVIAALLAMLVVGGAMLFGMGNPAQAQSVPEPPCTTNFCIDKTATPSTATAGEPITFTITQRCPGNGELGCLTSRPIVDTLPPEAGLTNVSLPAACTRDGNTVTCAENRFFTATRPYTLTIVATPTTCGTFTNTASFGGNQSTATATFTVLCRDTRHPRVISTVPTKGATGLGPNANIKATFSEDMLASSINANTFKLFKKGSTTKVGATVSYNPNLDTATLNPNNPLQRGTTYKAIVTNLARDEAGNRLDQRPGISGLQKKVWFFKVSD